MSRFALRPVTLRGLSTVHASPDVRLHEGAGATGTLVCDASDEVPPRPVDLQPPGTVVTCRRCVPELEFIESAAKRLRGAGGNGGLV